MVFIWKKYKKWTSYVALGPSPRELYYATSLKSPYSKIWTTSVIGLVWFGLSFLFFFFRFILCMKVFACLYVCAPHVCLVPAEVRGYQIPGTVVIDGWLWAATIISGYSGKAASVVKMNRISSSNNFIFFNFTFEVFTCVITGGCSMHEVKGHIEQVSSLFPTCGCRGWYSGLQQ